MSLVSVPARADTPPTDEPCGVTLRPWVRFVEPEGAERPPGFPFIVRHVRAELGLKGIDACVTGTGKPLAVVEIIATSSKSVEVSVDVKDAVTQKRVSRVLDLRPTPPDARPLAIAVGTDELLVASWVELALDKRPAVQAPPLEVERVVRVAIAQKPREARGDVGIAVTFDSYGGGQRFIGVDARGSLRLLERLAMTFRLGFRSGFETVAPGGTVDATAWVVGSGLRVPLVAPSHPFGLDAIARTDLLWLAYTADAAKNAVARSQRSIAILAAAGLAARFSPGKGLRLALECTLGTPLRPTYVTDDGARVTAVSGAALATGGEVALLF